MSPLHLEGPICGDPEVLEALARGELPAERRTEVLTHVGSCRDCTAEVAWLKAEQELFARRTGQRAADPQKTQALWAEIERRTAKPAARPRHVRAYFASAGLLAAAAVAIFAFWHVRPTDRSTQGRPGAGASARHGGRPDQKGRLDRAQIALDHAEMEYQRDIAALQVEYDAHRSANAPVAARYDTVLAATRRRLADEGTVARGDVAARMRVIDGYADYLRSLQTATHDLEANP